MTTNTTIAKEPTDTSSSAPVQAKSAGDVAVFQKPRLPWHPAIEASFGDLGVSKATWNALTTAIFPAAKSVDSVILALSYCKARKLDPFKRPVHIVPVWDSEKRGYVDTVWPGISELRTTAVRTGNFAGFDAVKFGPDKTQSFEGVVGSGDRQRTEKANVTFPEWATLTVYRMIGDKRVAVEGPTVYWLETYNTIGKTDVPNSMWARRPRGQLEKCAEAAALRRAFPEELGSEYAAEEVNERFYNGTTIDATPGPAKAQPAQNAKAALDGLVVDADRQQGSKPASEEPHDSETGEVLDQAALDAGDAAEAEEAARQEEDPVDPNLERAQLMTQKAIEGLTDPDFKTAAQVDEFAALTHANINAAEGVGAEDKAILIGRFNQAALEKKRSLGAKAKPATTKL